MDRLLTLVVWLVALPVTACCAVVIIECWAAAFAECRRSKVEDCPRPSVAVLVPAHNESIVIAPTLIEIRRQLASGDRLLVVADNCTDDTAEIAGNAATEVVVRFDDEKRGKAFALEFGIQHLSRNPPDVLLLCDADTIPQPGSIDRLVSAALATRGPVQALYRMDPPDSPSKRDLVSCFAFTVKTIVRPLGLTTLGIPVPITGTGIAIPWTIAAHLPLDGANIVEDMQLGIELAVAGTPASLCPDACFLGVLPKSAEAATVQRTRWEHGHIQTILTQTPRLVWHGVKQRRLKLILMAVDLLVPPLSLLCLSWATATGITAAAILLGAPPAPMAVLLAIGALLLATIIAVHFRYARNTLPMKSLLVIPFYVLWKLPLYFAFLVHREKAWRHTEREVHIS